MLEKYPQFCVFKESSPPSSLSPSSSSLLSSSSASNHPSRPRQGSFITTPLLPLRSPLTSFTHLNTSHSRTEKEHPIQILDFLFIGGQEAAQSREILEKYNITYILNAAQECEDLFVNNPKYHYKRLDLLDHGSQNLDLELFRDAFKFIDEAKKCGGKVLVHCRAGQSRSATIVITYLIHKFHWSLQQAYKFVQDKRPAVAPNLGFMAQIIQFEKTELARSSPSAPLSSSTSTTFHPLQSPLLSFLKSSK